MLDASLPFIFQDGTKAFKKLADQYNTHKRGLFILGPSGIGKTHFITHHGKNDWVDGDILWYATNALPGGKYWENGPEEINRIESRCDVITVEAKHKGFWIIGASNFWLKPDAIVIPDWETHKGYIVAREQKGYDGGLTSNQLAQLQAHRQIILEWEKQDVPHFQSVKEATEALAQNS